MSYTILNPHENPHKISLYYTLTKDFVTVTLDLSKSDFTLTEEDKQKLSQLPLKRDKSAITDKKAVLTTLRHHLLDVTEACLSICVKHGGK
jgi:hypothetical protein